jgi:hypothetical protein
LDDRATTAQSLVVTRHLQRQSVAIFPRPACIWRSDEPDRNIGAPHLRTGDDEGFDRALEQVVPTLDTLDNRITLARAVVALRDRGRIPAKLAAVAVLELDRPESMLFLSSVAESISVLAGDSCTPAGLLVATR